MNFELKQETEWKHNNPTETWIKKYKYIKRFDATYSTHTWVASSLIFNHF